MNWSSGSGYSSKEIDRMQREAMERVKEMQERSRRALGSETAPSPPEYPPFMKRPQPPSERGHDLPPQPQPHSPAPPPENKGGLLGGLFGGGNPLGSLGSLFTGGANGPITRVMDALGIDNDKIIILALIFILINNQADKKLILALCYILF